MFEDRTAEQIRAEIAADIGKKTGISVLPGGLIDTEIGRAAVEISKCYGALNAAPSMIFVDETSGGFLDLNADANFGFTRKEGTKAACAMTFSGTAGLVLPKGTAFLTAGGLAFLLAEAVILSTTGNGSGTAIAEAVGSRYNVGAGALTEMVVNPPGLAGHSNAPAAGGTDTESDSALFARLRDRRQRPSGSGNVHDYRRWVLEVPGTGDGKIIPLEGGPGTVGILAITPELLPADGAILDAVRSHVADCRPVGPAITIGAPRRLAFSVAAAVSISPATTKAEVRGKFVSELDTYRRQVVGEKYGRVYYSKADDLPYRLLYNKIGAILMGIEGVQNYTGLTVGGAGADLELRPDEVPGLPEVTIT